uniref:Uncharacterized protein n=1 Tax=Chromera velia CCMP2878 TaxID=1169474 RepID=A0A0G4FAX8_9ALVE|mmetsp:Transcript_49186/g.96972  ORF Transcript_49186/g.96972 Transcript_49186/m.96972 type:complete len:186 (+) Transcript_49186:126-683(+)|eukprot:Cvel_16080.t1-p1 / transcript=Cvel_16080.t1 / gene=Cvel_16080 / organism=Chromera_velia_CCMP2878 / gene_product=hypothetical protein / transcript_product=hypothetical protein / location=Cvel_scaffold1222:22393-22947(+) / protein_length=185 / sequence_SO=supercontig / SO=protein_coding / is_pseudo=false
MKTGQPLPLLNLLLGTTNGISPIFSDTSIDEETQTREGAQQQTEGEGMGVMNGEAPNNPLRAVSTASSLFMPPSAIAVCSAIRADTFGPGMNSTTAALPSPPNRYAEIRRKPDGETVRVRQSLCTGACPGRYRDVPVFRRLYTGMVVAVVDTVEGVIEEGELFCPRCRGSRGVYRIIQLGETITP